MQMQCIACASPLDLEGELLTRQADEVLARQRAYDYARVMSSASYLVL